MATETKDMLEAILRANGATDVPEPARLGSEIEDAELLDRWVEIMFCGLKRERIKDSNVPKPLETWHGFTRTLTGKLAPRSLRGRSHLSNKLMTQLAEVGLQYAELTTGELAQLPGETGTWGFRDAAGNQAVLLTRVRLDPAKGKLHGDGRRIFYDVMSWGVLVAQAQRAFPALSQAAIGGVVMALEGSEEPLQLPEPKPADPKPAESGPEAKREPEPRRSAKARA